MEELNKLLNDALQTKSQDYISPNGMINCCKAFEKLSSEDSAASKVLMYFFPENSSLEKNRIEYWFIKYKNDLDYNEDSFAKDLLKFFIQYQISKDKLLFEMKVKEKIQQFKERKLISEFYFTVEKTKESINATIAYIVKNPNYFMLSCKIKAPPEKIQKHSLIREIKHYFEMEKLRTDLQNGLDLIDQYSNLVKDLNTAVINLKEDKKKMEGTINTLIKLQNETALNLKNINEKLEQVDLRDSNKISFRCLYKFSYSKFLNDMEDA